MAATDPLAGKDRTLRVRLRPWIIVLSWTFAALACRADTPLRAATVEIGLEPAVWKFETGSEYPGARGSLVSPTTSQAPCLELHYDFTPPSEAAPPFDPHYVYLTRNLDETERFSPAYLCFRQQVSRPELSIQVRLEDATGQTLQYRAPGYQPLSESSPEGWRQTRVALSSPDNHWGGANDGRLHPPLRKIAILLDATGRRDSGFVRLADLRFEPAPIGNATFDLSTAPLTVPPPNAGALAGRVGANIHFTHDDRALRSIQGTGITWVRMDAAWESIEKTPGNYDFRDFDDLVSAAEKRHLTVLAILAYGNSHSTGGAMQPPRTPEALRAYGAFCEAFAKHYANRSVAFEIWNEPDVPGFWGGKPDAAEFARLLRTGLAAVKRSNPTAVVLPGGLSTPYDATYAFWDDLENADAFVGASGWGAHLYTDGAPEARWTDILRLRNRIDRTMPGRSLWCSEWGFSSTKLSTDAPRNGHSQTARHLQAAKTVRALLLAWWANLPLTVIYDWRDDGDNPADPEHNFGLVARDGSEKPALVAVRALLRFAKGKKIAGIARFDEAPAFHALKLKDENGRTTYIVWLEDGAPPCAITGSLQGIQATDMLGAPLPIQRENGEATISVSAEAGPVYIEAAQK